MSFVFLHLQEKKVLGRGVFGVGNDQRVSRNHAEVGRETGSRGESLFYVKAVGMNPIYVVTDTQKQTYSSTGVVRVNSPERYVWSLQAVRRAFFLIRDQDHQLLYEYLLEDSPNIASLSSEDFVQNVAKLQDISSSKSSCGQHLQAQQQSERSEQQWQEQPEQHEEQQQREQQQKPSTLPQLSYHFDIAPPFCSPTRRVRKRVLTDLSSSLNFSLPDGSISPPRLSSILSHSVETESTSLKQENQSHSSCTSAPDSFSCSLSSSSLTPTATNTYIIVSASSLKSSISQRALDLSSTSSPCIQSLAVLSPSKPHSTTSNPSLSRSLSSHPPGSSTLMSSLFTFSSSAHSSSSTSVSSSGLVRPSSASPSTNAGSFHISTSSSRRSLSPCLLRSPHSPSPLSSLTSEIEITSHYLSQASTGKRSKQFQAAQAILAKRPLSPQPIQPITIIDKKHPLSPMKIGNSEKSKSGNSIKDMDVTLISSKKACTNISLLYQGIGAFMATPGLGGARKKILCEAFEKKGGIILHNLRDLKIHNKLTRIVVICSEHALRETPQSFPSTRAIPKHLKFPKISRSWEVHTVEWLTESNSKQMCLGKHEYPIEPLLERLQAEDKLKAEIKLKTAALNLGQGGSASDDEESTKDELPMTTEQAMQHNSVLVTKLEELARVHRVRAGKEDVWRGITFSKAANIIKAYPKPIRRGQDCQDIKGLGAKCIQKIDEILRTGSLQRLEVMQKDPKIVAMDLFLTVHGIGPASALKYWDQGLRTLDDLRTKADLTVQQRLFLNHYDDLTSPIPRAEVEEVEKLLILQARALNLSKIDVIICGSYRRGKEFSGDIDVLIASHDPNYVPRVSKRLGQTELGRTLSNTSPFLKTARNSHGLGGTNTLAAPSDYATSSASSFLSSVASVAGDGHGTGQSNPDFMILEALVANLVKLGFLTEHIALPSDHERWGQSKNIFEGHDNETYMGICKLPGENRKRHRIDMKVYHVSEIAFAVMYFTGSKEFNRAMRLYANKRFKLSLSDHALTPYEFKNDGTRDKVATGPGLPCYAERDIFEALKLPYLEPWERNGVPAFLLQYAVEERSEELARQKSWREQKTNPQLEPLESRMT